MFGNMQMQCSFHGETMMILASASPRRKELMSLIVPKFEIVAPDVDETCSIKEVREKVRFLAEKKAGAVHTLYPHAVVIGADTLVEVQNEVLGKPVDRNDAQRMLALLSGKNHSVHTGVCVWNGENCIAETFTTKVTFQTLSDDEIEEYLTKENVMDKAGAYAIQGIAAKFVTGIEGCFFNVVGLPVSGVYQILKKLEAME